jgi:hypothetical protein
LLKSLDTVLEDHFSIDNVREAYGGGDSGGSVEGDKPSTVIFAGGFTANEIPSLFDMEEVNEGVNGVDGVDGVNGVKEAQRRLSPHLFPRRVRAPKMFKGRYDRLNVWNELPGRPNVFLAGSNTHSRDYKQSAGGFVHGFRYTAKTTILRIAHVLGKTPTVLPYEVVEGLDDLWHRTILRIQSSSTLWHLEG